MTWQQIWEYWNRFSGALLIRRIEGSQTGRTSEHATQETPPSEADEDSATSILRRLEARYRDSDFSQHIGG